MNTVTTTPLDKTFDPAAIEAKWYKRWEDGNLFRPARPDAQPFTIVNPPPNVTGSLHIGHALDNTLQDIVVRYERLRGKDALWVVGTDHAGIATQMVVERRMEERQDKRTNYTREAFVEKVWEWKRESGGTITQQLRRLGCSMDWSREQFTMDPHFTKAVVKVFVDLYNQGLIYRDKRLVNWDPKLKTAISDLEVETREIKGGFWHFRYPLADGVTRADGLDYVVVATTRPETMLADMAVAVSAEDPRYQSVIGKFITLPITGRRIPIVADEHADPELGSGAVKITPGHDFNDFEVGRRMGIKAGDMLNMLDAEARVVQVTDGLIPEKYLAQDRFDVRAMIVADMKEAGFLVPWTDKDGTEHDAEPRTIQTPFGDRGGVVIEPWLTDQWYVDAATLAGPPMDAVRDGRIEIVPKTWEKTFFNWMENIQPWCVSRQLWWGHRIPAWFGPIVDEPTGITEEGRIIFKSDSRKENYENEVFVANDEEAAIQQAASVYGVELSDIAVVDTAQDAVLATILGQAKRVIWRDEDVLDTWFSSALWPFATLGWPEDAGGQIKSVHAEPVEALPFSSDQAPSLEEKSSPSTSSGWTGVGLPPSPSGEGPGVGSLLPRGAASGDRPPPNPSPEGEGLARNQRNLLARHYPNDLLISGFDILFFWCARMAMQGMHFMHEVPWKRLYLHGLVRAADGQKMSKSKGNVVDPLGLIDQYGADALRFFMAAMESQGRDVKMDEKRVEGYRNFATKLWNAARFCQANGIGASTTLAAPDATLAVNTWIIGEVVETLAELDKAMADLRFDAAANAIYHFVWDTFCDWYIELIKGAFDDETKAVAGWVLDQILVMLHPFMPFVTEELWDALGERDAELIVARWPEPGALVDPVAKREVEWLVKLVSEIRAGRTELNIKPGMEIFVQLQQGSALGRERLDRHAAVLTRLAKTTYTPLIGGDIEHGGSMQVVVDGDIFVMPLQGVIDIDAERGRLAKAVAASEKERDALAKRLDNPSFVEKAKPEAVEKARADHAAHAAEAERLAAALARLG